MQVVERLPTAGVYTNSFCHNSSLTRETTAVSMLAGKGDVAEISKKSLSMPTICHISNASFTSGFDPEPAIMSG